MWCCICRDTVVIYGTADVADVVGVVSVHASIVDVYVVVAVDVGVCGAVCCCCCR